MLEKFDITLTPIQFDIKNSCNHFFKPKYIKEEVFNNPSQENTMIPLELWGQIFSQMTFKELTKIMLVCKFWGKEINDTHSADLNIAKTSLLALREHIKFFSEIHTGLNYNSISYNPMLCLSNQ